MTQPAYLSGIYLFIIIPCGIQIDKFRAVSGVAMEDLSFNDEFFSAHYAASGLIRRGAFLGEKAGAAQDRVYSRAADEENGRHFAVGPDPKRGSREVPELEVARADEERDRFTVLHIELELEDGFLGIEFLLVARAASNGDKAIGMQLGEVLDQLGDLVGIELEFVQARGFVDPGPF